jgi:hypothetical protein
MCALPNRRPASALAFPRLDKSKPRSYQAGMSQFLNSASLSFVSPGVRRLSARTGRSNTFLMPAQGPPPRRDRGRIPPGHVILVDDRAVRRLQRKASTQKPPWAGACGRSLAHALIACFGESSLASFLVALVSENEQGLERENTRPRTHLRSSQGRRKPRGWRN